MRGRRWHRITPVHNCVTKKLTSCPKAASPEPKSPPLNPRADTPQHPHPKINPYQPNIAPQATCSEMPWRPPRRSTERLRGRSRGGARRLGRWWTSALLTWPLWRGEVMRAGGGGGGGSGLGGRGKVGWNSTLPIKLDQDGLKPLAPSIAQPIKQSSPT